MIHDYFDVNRDGLGRRNEDLPKLKLRLTHRFWSARGHIARVNLLGDPAELQDNPRCDNAL